MTGPMRYANITTDANGVAHLPDEHEPDEAARARLDEQDDAPLVIPNDAVANEPAKIATVALSGNDLAKPLPPIDYIVQSLAMPSGAGAAHCFAGFGFSGKSVAAQAMLVALASNRGVWRAFTGPGRVLRCTHIDNEQGVALTQRRYQRIANAMGISLEDLGDALRLYVFPRLSTGARVLLSPDHRPYWREIMTDRDVCLVDSIAASRDGVVSENAAEVRRSIDMLSELSEETKCRPIVVHHANKPSDNHAGVERDPRFALRGSSSIFDSCDSIYLLSGAKSEAVKVEQIKARSHGEPIPDFALVIADVARETDPRWGLSVHIAGLELIEEQRERKAEVRAETQIAAHTNRIRKALAGGKRLGRKELEAATRLNGANLTRAWQALSDAGEVDRVEEKRGRNVAQLHFLRGAP